MIVVSAAILAAGAPPPGTSPWIALPIILPFAIFAIALVAYKTRRRK